MAKKKKKKSLYQKFWDDERLTGDEIISLYAKVLSCLIAIEELGDPDFNLALFKLRQDEMILKRIIMKKGKMKRLMKRKKTDEHYW